MDPETHILITTFEELKDAIEEGNIDKFNEKYNWFKQNLERKKQVLSDLYTSDSQCITQTDVILAACRNKPGNMLPFLLYETDILDQLPGTSFDDPKVITQRTEAFKHAIIINDFNKVEMLYDYWCGDMYWISHDISKIRTLGKLLEDAPVVCTSTNNDKNTEIHIQCLIKFNAFQQIIYQSLAKIPPAEEAWRLSMLMEVLNIYDEYSDLDKVRLPMNTLEAEQETQDLLNDQSSEIKKAFLTTQYETYFRKLDFNIALLILENWNVLRKHLKERFNKPREYYENYPDVKDNNKKMVTSYKEIECALYHFIYRTYENWRLYLDDNRNITTVEIPGDNGENIKITHDAQQLYNIPVLYLERKNFNGNMKKLRELVVNTCNVDPAKNWTATKKIRYEILLNDNYLKPTMYMSNYFSLSKVVYYLNTIEQTNTVNVLILQRVLQVTGEMLKSTDATYHLSESTKSLLQIAISEETLKYLNHIRTFLSKADVENVSAKNAIASQVRLFKDVKKDLDNIKPYIDSIREVYKFILDESLLRKGLVLLDERLNSFPDNVLRQIDEIFRRYLEYNEFFENEILLRQLKADTGLTTQLLQEICWTLDNKRHILPNIESGKTNIGDYVKGILPTYIRNIRNLIKLNNKNENSVIEIREVLSFFVKECKLFEPGHQINEIDFEEDLPTYKVIDILKELEDKCKSNLQPTLTHSFDGIKKLHETIRSEKLIQKELRDSPKIVRRKLISFLIDRVSLLIKTLGYPQDIHLAGTTPADYHIQRYKHDKEFRFVLEMILADIGNVLAQCEIKKLMKKSNKSLIEIDLGNVLDHGNPFLEVIGDIFDSNDIPFSFLSKAYMFVKDKKSIEAIYELFKANIDYQTIIEEKLEKMNDDQKLRYKEFQESPNWKSYAHLILK